MALETLQQDWGNIVNSGPYQQAKPKERLGAFNNFLSYHTKDYEDRLAQAPEEERPAIQSELESFRGWGSERLNKLSSKYSLPAVVARKIDDEGVSEAYNMLRETEPLLAQGFEPAEVEDAREKLFQHFKQEFDWSRGLQGDPADNTPADGGNFIAGIDAATRAKPMNEDELRSEFWNNAPGFFMALPELRNAMATQGWAGIMGAVSGLSDTIDMGGDMIARAVGAQPTENDPFKTLAQWSAQQQTDIRAGSPIDPRRGWMASAAAQGISQIPGQLATAWNTPINFARNFGEVSKELSDSIFEAKKQRLYADQVESGRLDKNVPFSQWEKTLSQEATEDLRGAAVGEATLWALPSAAVETLSEKFALNVIPWEKLGRTGKSIANVLSWGRRTAPKVALGTQIMLKGAAAGAAGSAEEATQQVIQNVAVATNTGDFSPDKLVEGTATAAVAGFFAEGGMSAASIPATARREKSLKWASEMVEGKGAAYEAEANKIKTLAEQKGEDHIETVEAKKNLDAQVDEAHWIASRSWGIAGIDQARVDRVETRRQAREKFQTKYAQWLKNERATPADGEERGVISELQNKLGQIRETYGNLRRGFTEGGFTEAAAALDRAEKNQQARAEKDAATKLSEAKRKAEEALLKFVGTARKPGEGRAEYARVVVDKMFPDFVFSPDFANDDVVAGILDAVEGGALREGDNVQDWLAGSAQTKAASSAAGVEAKNLNQGGVNNGQQENQTAQGQKPGATAAVSATSGTEQGTGPGVAPGDGNGDGAGTGTGAGAGRPAAAEPEPEITIARPDGTQVRMTRTGFLEAYNSLYDEILGLGNLTPENVGNVINGARALEQIADEAPELSPEQKAEWKKPVEGLRAYLEAEQAKLQPGQSVEVRAGDQNQDQNQTQGPATSLDQTIADQTPVRLGNQVGVLTRDPETGRPVFKADDNTEIELRVREEAAEKAPEALAPSDFGTETDAVELLTASGKRFSVLPQRETPPARPVFVRNQGGENNGLRQETQNGRTEEVISPSPTPAPQPAVDMAAIEAAVKSVPDAHRKTDGRRKLVSREVAVVLMDRINKEAAANDGKITRKRVLELGKEMGATNPQALALAELAQSPEALTNTLRGDYDDALGLFDRTAQNQDTREDREENNDNEGDVADEPSNLGDLSPNERWVNDAFAVLEDAVKNLPNTAKNRAIKTQMGSEDGRTEIKRKLGGIYSVSLDDSLRANGVLDPVVREQTLERILRGEDSQTKPGTLTRNVLGDLIRNLNETGDPFTVKTSSGETVAYSAQAVYRRELAPALRQQNRRNRERPGNPEKGTTEDDRPLGRGSNLDTDPERTAAKSELAQLKIQATRDAVEEVADELAAELGVDGQEARLAMAKILQDAFPGLEVDAVSMGWRSPDEKLRAKQTVLRKLKGRERETVERLVTRMKRRLDAASRYARMQGLLGSGAVVDMDDTTLADILTRQLAEESELGEAQTAAAQARETGSLAPLEPLLAKIAQSEVLSATIARAVAVNSLGGRMTTNSTVLASLTPEDMQQVLASPFLPDSLREVLGAATEVGGGDPLAYVAKHGPRWAKDLAGLLAEQNSKHSQSRGELFWNLGLMPSLGTAQGLWAGGNRSHVSLFLDPETRAATVLHEAMHGVWDWKMRAYIKDAGTTLLTTTERAALDELVGLKNIVEAEALRRIAEAEARGDSPETIARMRRDMLGGFRNTQINLQEFLNEAINHKPFQEFLAGITDPNAKDKTSLFRRVLNAILRLMRGNEVALDSVLQRSFELSMALAKDTRDAGMDIRNRNALQVEFFRDNEARLGRPMSLEEIDTASRLFEMAYPKSAAPATIEEAIESAPDVLSPEELNAFNSYLEARESAGTVLSASQENIPGSESGLLAGLAQAPYAVKDDYHRQTNEALIDPETGRDTVAEILGIADPKVLARGPSVYSPKAGVVEFNPADILVGFASVEDATRYMLLRGAFTNQNAIGGIDPQESGDKEAAVFDLGRVPTETEIRQIYNALKKPGDTAIYLNERGLSIVKLGFDDSHDNTAWNDSINAVQSLLTVNAGLFQTNTIYHENEYDKRTNPTDDPYGLKSQTAAARLSLGQASAVRPLDIQAGAATRLRARLAAVDQRFAEQGYGNAVARKNQLLEDLGLLTPPTLAQVLESASTTENDYYERLTHQGTDPLTGGRTGIGKYRRGYSPTSGNEGAPTRGRDFPDAVRRRNQGTHSRIEQVRRAINEAIGGLLRQEQGSRLIRLLLGKDEAPEGSTLAEALAELRAEIPVIPVSALKGLKQIDEGMSSKVFADAKNASIYKLVSVKDGKVGGTFPRDIRVRPEDGAVMVTGSRTIDMMDAIDAVIIGNKQGSAVFTEVAAVTDDGRLVLKQPYVKGLREIEMFEDGSSDISEDLRTAIEELGMEIVSEMGSPVAVGRVGTRWAIFDDLHGNNVMRDANGRAVFVDALATRLLAPGEVELLRPYIKSEQRVAESAATQQDTDTAFESRTEAMDYVRRKFLGAATQLKTGIFPNYGGHMAQYVVQSQQGGHFIEINPNEFVGLSLRQVDAIMREELIHAASGLVLQRKGIDFSDFFTDLGRSLSKSQRMALKKVYTSAQSDRDIGAEYFRAGVQKLLYGTITEKEMGGTAMQKIIALLKDVVAYFQGRKLDPETRKVYEDTVAMVRKADRKNIAKPGQVRESAAISFAKAEGRSLGFIADQFDAEAPNGRLLAGNDTKGATDVLRAMVNRETSRPLSGLGGRKVNLVSPDETTASKLSKETRRRWDNEAALIEARIIHALTNEDRTTFNSNKIRTAALVPETIRNADVVTEFEMATQDEGRIPFVAFSKLYQDPESPTGQRWHTVEVRKNRMAFETQYSSPDLESGRIFDSKVVTVGRATPKKKTLAGAGQASEVTPGVETGAVLGVLPDVSPNQGQANIDSTTGENVQNNFGAVPRLSAPVVQVGFEPLTFGPESRKVTQALARVRGEAEYAPIERALGKKTYIAWTEEDTQRKAEEFLDTFGGNLEGAFIAADKAPNVPFEQVIAIKATAAKRAQEAATAARLEAEKLPAQIAGVSDEAVKAKLYQKLGSLRTLEEHYQSMAMSFTESLMEMGSAAGSELRAFRLLADIMAPASWVRQYKAAIVKTQAERLSKDKLAQRIGTELNAARTAAANRTAERMKKALASFARGFVPNDATRAEIEAAEKLATELSSPLPVREAIVQAAVEDTVVQGIETLRRSLSPEQQADPSFLEAWEQRLRQVATEQINAAVESRMQGGRVDAAPTPAKTEAEIEAETRARELDTWRSLGDLPLAELVFNLAKEKMAEAGGPYAGLLDTATFAADRSSRLKKAVRMSINLSEEIRKTTLQRGVSAERLVSQLAETNPELSESELRNLAEAVEAVYNAEVNEAARAALERIVKNSANPKAKAVLTKRTVEDLMPLVNMGAFSTEAAYNAIAEKFGLPTWDPQVAADIEQKAVALQGLPAGSIQRQESAQLLALEIAKANIKASRGKTRLQHLNQMASSLWTSLILSAPPTQIVNAGMSGVSVLVESLAEATGYYLSSRRQGISHADAAEFFKDAMKAWRFAAGKDASNVSRRAIEEGYTALTKGTQKFKSSKYEELSAFEMFKFDESAAIPGNAMMEAIMSGEWAKAAQEGGKAAAGAGVGGAATVLLGPLALPIAMAENAVRRAAGEKGRQSAMRSYMATVRMVGRMMLTADAMNSMVAASSKQLMMKRALLLADPNLTEAQVEQQMKEIEEGGSKAAKENALLIAEDEADRGDFGPKGTQAHAIAKARRVEQLIELETYGADVLGSARDFAGMATFNGEASGAIGAMMMTIFGGANRLFGIAAKPFNPFPRTVSNLLNNALNYMPVVGQLRAEGKNFSSFFIDEKSKYYKAPPERGSAEYYSLHARAAFGTVAMVLLGYMLKSSWEERKRGETPLFEINANGPADIAKRRQWQASGGKPFTVRFGDIQLRYTDWPALNIVLGALGTVYDEGAYGDAEADATDRIFNALVSVAGVTLNRNMLGGASALFDVLSSGTPGQVKQAALKKLGGSYVGGFAKPALTRYLETIATGTYGETQTAAGYWASQIPLAGPLRGKPSLNILGEPIEVNPMDATVGRLANLRKTHPILSPLTEAELWIRPPQRYRIADPSKESGSRKMTSEEFYQFTEFYGKEMAARLNESQVATLVKLAETNPQLAQDRLDQLATFSRNAAQQLMRLRKAKQK